MISQKPGRTSPPFRGFPVFLCFLFSCLAVPLGSDSFGCDSAALCPSVVGFLPLSRHAHFQSGTAWPPCFRSSSHRWRPGASARRRFSRFPFFLLQARDRTRIVTRVRGDMPKGFPAIFVGWGNSLPSPPVRRGTTDPRPPRTIERKWIHEDEKSKAAELGR